MDFGLTLLAGYWIFRGLSAILEESKSTESKPTPLYTPPSPPLPESKFRLPVGIAARTPSGPTYANARALFSGEYVSFTRLDTFAKCRRKFKLTYLNGYRQADRDQSKAARSGNDFHDICHRLFSANQGRTLGSLLTSPEVRQDGRLGQVLRCQPTDSVVLASELELRFRADDREFLGYVDLVVERPDGMVSLIDYKTGYNRNYKPDPIQLDIYSIPELLLRPHRQVHLCFVLVDANETTVWTNSANNRESVIASIKRRIEQVEAETEFTPNRGGLCNYCHARQVCEGTDQSIYRTFARQS